ncbi:MAG: diguanylate cyclase [Burkholderiales bacterium]|nr:diguanylate cyclase [Burkholderiales bacterium]
MTLLSRLPLRALLTLPYLVLVLGTAIVIGVLSYAAGRDTVDDLSGQLLTETVHRIEQAVEGHVSGSAAVLEVAFPKGIPAPESIAAELPALRERFWLATSVHRDPNNYAYYGDRDGRFIGLWRASENDAELRLRTEGTGPRSLYHYSGIAGDPGRPDVERRIFEPRERPWYKAGSAVSLQTWTSIYIDFKLQQLVATRARRVNDRAGAFKGVVATDLSLQQVTSFLQRLALSANGVAMVMEKDGNLIGVSRGAYIRKQADGTNVRLNAADSSDPLVTATYAAVRSLADTAGDARPHTTVFTAPDGSAVQVGYARLTDDAGLDWLIMVAVPRKDFLHGILDNFRRTVLLAVIAAVFVMLTGTLVLATVTRELRRLAAAARRVGEGSAAPFAESQRKDELGDLARSLADMQRRLLTDPLTGLANREALIRRVEERIVAQRRRGDSRPFGVLFVDINHFKKINDEFGHDIGDAVLRELGRRLAAAVDGDDLVARFAGDEFLVLLDAIERREDAERVRVRIEQVLRQPLELLTGSKSLEPALGAAVGVAVYPEDGQDVETLVRHADQQMYLRKRAD